MGYLLGSVIFSSKLCIHCSVGISIFIQQHSRCTDWELCPFRENSGIMVSSGIFIYGLTVLSPTSRGLQPKSSCCRNFLRAMARSSGRVNCHSIQYQGSGSWTDQILHRCIRRRGSICRAADTIAIRYAGICCHLLAIMSGYMHQTIGT